MKTKSENNYNNSARHSLLADRRFLPIFLTQFFGAFNDNVFKNAMVILITYRLAEQAAIDGKMMVTAAAGVFILPFFIFSATAGQLADKYEKSSLIRKIKFAEIFIMLFGTLAFFAGDVYFLMAVLFLMGAQSAFFGPLKYSILPDHLEKTELVGGNALVSASTFIAILAGTIFGGILIMTDSGVAIISAAVLVFAVAGWISSLYVPAAKPAFPDLHINKNIFLQTLKSFSHVTQNKEVAFSVLGISWFWFVGATFLAQFPNFAKHVLGTNEEVVTLMLTAFSVGVGIGALLCSRILKGRITARYVPLGGLGISIFSADLFFASSGVSPSLEIFGATQFLQKTEYIRILFDLLAVAICGGFFIVPLYATMQYKSAHKLRARTVAGNNIVNSMMMVVSALVTIVMFTFGFTIADIFAMIAIANFLVTVIIYLSPLHAVKN